MKKEDIGGAIKKAVRLIPGIGSYQSRESLRDADKKLRVEVSRRLDELIGVLEWVKTDQLKKGDWKRIKDLEDLERDLEKASRLIERAARGYGSVFDGPRVDEDVLQKIYEYDKGIWELLGPVKKDLGEFTEKGVVPERSKVDAIRKQLRELMNRMGRRDEILKGLGDLSD